MRRGISQEGLKLIACLAMLTDHAGYVLVHPIYMQISLGNGGNLLPEARLIYAVYLMMRIIGRLSFPIFAFLLAEGFCRTRNRKKYALRLVIGMLLSEIPYNLAVSGSPVWRYQQSIMVTLLLGFLAMQAMEKCRSSSWKPVAMLPFLLAAELLQAEYGWAGVALIAMFDLSREMYNRNLIRFFAMLILFHYMPSAMLSFGNIQVPMQVLGALSMLFLVAYDGRKMTAGKAVQWGFYLFYPVHLLFLYILSIQPGVFQIGITTVL